MPQPDPANKAAKTDLPAVTWKSYLTLAGFLEGKETVGRLHKQDSGGKALRAAGEMYESRDYVSAYQYFKSIYDKVVSDMQRVLARNSEIEANKLAQQQRKPLAVAKENVQQRKGHAQQVIDQFERLLQDLEGKALVRAYLKKGASKVAEPHPDEAPPTTLNSAGETRLESKATAQPESASNETRYKVRPYAPPEKGALYTVRDKTGSERIIRVVAISPDGQDIQVETLKSGKPSQQPIQLKVESLARQAARGLCSLLVPISEETNASHSERKISDVDIAANKRMRLDIQNFGRCCGDIARANINFSTQLIKDVGDGPFRAGDFQQAFLTFEQLSIGFNSAVASSRRTIADGRRTLTAEKGKLSGKEIQDRTAAFTRSEQLIHTAEREFATILEGLRMYLRATQDFGSAESFAE